MGSFPMPLLGLTTIIVFIVVKGGEYSVVF